MIKKGNVILLQCFLLDSFTVGITVYMRHQKSPLTLLTVNYSLFTHSDDFCRSNGENDNIVLESSITGF